MAWTMTSGCDKAGVMSAIGAIFAAPKIPNLIDPSFFSALGGPKEVKTRLSNVNILQYLVGHQTIWHSS
jgi:hypothetical protein